MDSWFCVSFFVFLDETRILVENALESFYTFYNNNSDAKVIYTDEASNIKGALPHYKPAWNVDLLYSNNYISKACFYASEFLKENKSNFSELEDIGYKAYEISAKTSQNLENVKTLMQNKIIMISGHSGVGKSTFINAIDPDVDIKTSAISDQHMQGKHTTTFAEMHKLKGGIRIIDTPGIKGFGIVEMGPQEIGNYFPEFFALKNACKSQ